MSDQDIAAYLQAKGVAVRPGGVDHLRMSCFFHGEDEDDRGRLYINVSDSPARGAWICFVCGEKGGFNKIRAHFGDDPLDEVERPGTTDTNLPDATFCRILSEAERFYHEQLTDHEEAFRYLRFERGFTIETIGHFGFGYATKDGLATHLIQQGFDLEDIKRTGLVTALGDDYLAGRITIPYRITGQTVAIRGRDLGGRSNQKYLGTSGGQSLLFNQDVALTSETLIVAEGEFDTASAFQLGFDAVGVPGANIWKDHWSTLLEGVKRVNIVFDPDKAGKAGADKLATKLGGKARVVQLPESMPGQPLMDLNQFLLVGNEGSDLAYLISKAKGGLLASVRDCYERWQEIEGNPNLNGLRLGVKAVDSHMRHGFLPGNLLTLLAATNSGKEQPVTEPVLTPNGWRKMGDLKPGDRVIGSNGHPTNVLGVYPQGEKDIYEITFSDGAKVRCGLDHLWTYRLPGSRSKYRTAPLRDIIPLVQQEGRRKVFVPLVEAVDFDDAEFTIDPYTLGVLLGDGGVSQKSVTVSTADPEILERLETGNLEIRHRSRYDYGIAGERKKVNWLREALDELGLTGRSETKFIPEPYLRGSAEQRWELLRGLMDTDGTVSSEGACEFTTSSQRLAEGVVELVRSLGGVTGWHGKGTRTKKTAGLDHYRITVTTPQVPFNLERKKARWLPPKRLSRAMDNVELVGREEAVCIYVEAEDHLYVSNDYVLTHNTIMTLNFFHRVAANHPDAKMLFVSLEQTRNEWWERARRIYSFYHPDHTTQDCLDFWSERMMVVDENRVSQDQLVELIEQYEFEMGYKPDLVAVDYLGYYARSFKGEAYERTSAAMMGLKRVAKDHQLVILTPHQVSRSNVRGTEISLDSARDSGVVGETADFVAGMWNKDQQVGINIADHQREVSFKVLKSRQGSTGQEVSFQFAPLTLAMIPRCDTENYERAMAERAWAANGDTWEIAVQRHLTGNQNPFLALNTPLGSTDAAPVTDFEEMAPGFGTDETERDDRHGQNDSS